MVGSLLAGLPITSVDPLAGVSIRTKVPLLREQDPVTAASRWAVKRDAFGRWIVIDADECKVMFAVSSERKSRTEWQREVSVVSCRRSRPIARLSGAVRPDALLLRGCRGLVLTKPFAHVLTAHRGAEPISVEDHSGGSNPGMAFVTDALGTYQAFASTRTRSSPKTVNRFV